MNWSDELRILRKYLRDPYARIWSNEILSSVWNQSQRELQAEIGLLEDVRALPVPPQASASYMHESERAFLEDADSNYRCLHSHQGWFAFTSACDAEVHFGSSAQATEDGSAYTHPWEAYMVTPNREPWHPWPHDMHSAKYVFYDGEPVRVYNKRSVAKVDPSYITREGEPLGIYDHADSENAFSLYPRPAVTFSDDVGEGMATFVAGDTVAEEIGLISYRPGTLDSEPGITLTVIPQEENVLVIYDLLPSDIAGLSDPLDMPPYMTKYVRYRALERAYGANTDGRIPSLSRLWGERYRAGLDVLKKFTWQRKRDRDYRLRTQRPGASRTRKHPRLPDKYPAV